MARIDELKKVMESLMEIRLVLGVEINLVQLIFDSLKMVAWGEMAITKVAVLQITSVSILALCRVRSALLINLQRLGDPKH